MQHSLVGINCRVWLCEALDFILRLYQPAEIKEHPIEAHLRQVSVAHFLILLLIAFSRFIMIFRNITNFSAKSEKDK
jgi:hypothetical protein